MVTKLSGKCIIPVKTKNKIDRMKAMMEVVERDELVFISTQGIVKRQSVKDLRVIGRNTQGVKVIRLKEEIQLQILLVFFLKKMKKLMAMEKLTNQC